ncbi:MAG: aldo/keto reductase [bacterium]
MKSRRLGKTGLVVSEICMGTMTFGSMADEKESHAILDRADAAGVDFYDVAEIYPVPPDPRWSGKSEEIVGSWLAKRGRRDTLFIATKIAGPSGGWFRAAVRGGRTALDRHNVERAVDASLERLGTDYIDLYQLHGFDALTPVEETLATLDGMVRTGKIRYIGCSNFSGWHLMKSLAASEKYGLTRYVAHQAYYSLVGREYEWELMPLALDQKVGAVVWSPLGWGRLTGKIRRGQPLPAKAEHVSGWLPPQDLRDQRASVQITGRLAARDHDAHRCGIIEAAADTAWDRRSC